MLSFTVAAVVKTILTKGPLTGNMKHKKSFVFTREVQLHNISNLTTTWSKRSRLSDVL